LFGEGEITTQLGAFAGQVTVDVSGDYVAGAEESLGTAADRAWTVVSIKNDWKTVFADTSS
jgi:hypothetical protein